MSGIPLLCGSARRSYEREPPGGPHQLRRTPTRARRGEGAGSAQCGVARAVPGCTGAGDGGRHPRVCRGGGRAGGVRGPPAGFHRADLAVRRRAGVRVPGHGRVLRGGGAAFAGRAGRAAFAEAFHAGTRLELAEAVRLALSTGERPTAADRSELSRREQEVAGLVAQGLTNREIADRLVLSHRMVETHVSRIMTKLGLGSRAQLAVWVVRSEG
ncbi:response regulator transcription factor [Streptomyces kaniharaensis]|uniref:Response regulator transcription factor n=1 Tax=Streptomyces kaniharaensis TaxID=212423 RepID=A0A6N7KTF9_9ACTN|nr:response regulator transcription factor [Streptomyces kaniharaensis]